MTKKYIAAAAMLFALASIALPLAAQAQFAPYWGPILSCTGNYTSEGTVVTAKCTSLCDLLSTVSNIVKFTYTVSLYVIAPLMFIYGGILFMIAGANHHGLSEAKKIMTGTVIAVLLILGSYLIVTTILYFLSVIGSVADGEGSDSPVHWPNIACNVQDLPGGEAGVVKPEKFILQEGESFGCRVVIGGQVVVRCSPSRSNTCNDISCGSAPCERVDSCTAAAVPAGSSGCQVPFKEATRFQCYPGSDNCNGAGACDSSSACRKFTSSNCTGTALPQ